MASAAAETRAPFTFRAEWGQRTTQRIHEMHFLYGCSPGICAAESSLKLPLIFSEIFLVK